MNKEQGMLKLNEEGIRNVRVDWNNEQGTRNVELDLNNEQGIRNEEVE
jgi:hypothetical protein